MTRWDATAFLAEVAQAPVRPALPQPPSAVPPPAGVGPAKAAKTAILQAGWGTSANSGLCDALLKPLSGAGQAQTDGCEFAALAGLCSSAHQPQSQQPSGLLRNSQPSQGVAVVPAVAPADAAPAAVATAAPLAWSTADIQSFTTRRARLLRWGWAEVDADTLATRLVQSDRNQQADPDDRVSCTDCSHYRQHHGAGRCANHRTAGLGTAEVARDLAGLLQRCPGFKGQVCGTPGGG
jgi:hypothetical protein